MKDYIGNIYNSLTVVDQKRENNRSFLLCKCKICGNEKWLRADRVVSGDTKSCCCYFQKMNQFKEIYNPGEIINNITLLEKTDKKKGTQCLYKCKCFCGNIFYEIPSLIKNGQVKSCGCKKIKYTPENLKKAIKKHLNENIVEGTNLQAIRIPLKSNNTSGVKGVMWDKSRNKWVAQIVFKKKRYFLGRYSNIEDAIRAREKAEEKYFKPILEKYEKKTD